MRLHMQQTTKKPKLIAHMIDSLESSRLASWARANLLTKGWQFLSSTMTAMVKAQVWVFAKRSSKNLMEQLTTGFLLLARLSSSSEYPAGKLKGKNELRKNQRSTKNKVRIRLSLSYRIQELSQTGYSDLINSFTLYKLSFFILITTVLFNLYVFILTNESSD